MHAVLCALLAIVGVGNLQGEQPGAENPVRGHLGVEPSKSKLPSDFQYRSMTLRFAVVFDTVTIGANFVTTSGQQQSATELFHMDGREHPGTLNPGVVITGKWVNAHVIETGREKGWPGRGRDHIPGLGGRQDFDSKVFRLARPGTCVRAQVVSPSARRRALPDSDCGYLADAAVIDYLAPATCSA